METVSVSDVRKRWDELSARVERTGERIIVERHGKPVLALVRVEDVEQVGEPPAPSTRAAAMAALARAIAVGDQILAERGGEPLPDCVETIHDMREERMRALSDLH